MATLDRKLLTLIERNLPEEIRSLVLNAATINYEENEELFRGLTLKDLYRIAFYHGYQTAYVTYMDEDDEIDIVTELPNGDMMIIEAMEARNRMAHGIDEEKIDKSNIKRLKEEKEK